MKKSVRQYAQGERGLTLVELIVVLLILGIIMTFLGGKILGAGDKAKVDLSRLKMQDLKLSIETFRLRYNSLPGSLSELTGCGQKTGEGCVPITSDDATADAWNNKFVYTLQSNNRSYQIKSLGADGVEGGDGVNFDAFVTGP